MVKNKEIEVDDINEFFNDLFELQKTGNYFFRGISKEEHYSPTLFREFQKVKKEEDSYTKVWAYEIALLEKFAQYSVQYLPAITIPLDWVASAQHFGIPTRLLDWTFDPFIGLYFSVFHNSKDKICDQKEDEWYRLIVVNKNSHLYDADVPIFKPSRNARYGLDTNYELLNEFIVLVRGLSGDSRYDLKHHARSSGYKREKEFAWKIKQDLDESDKPTKLFFCSINHSNPRIVAQNGLFQIPRTYGYGAGKGWIKDDIVRGCDRIYKIHKDKRQKILYGLSTMNVNSIRLFPDLQNICDYIRRTTCYNTDENKEGIQS